MVTVTPGVTQTRLQSAERRLSPERAVSCDTTGLEYVLYERIFFSRLSRSWSDVYPEMIQHSPTTPHRDRLA